MPKKEKVWEMGMPRGGVGPWVWHVWIKGKKKPEWIAKAKSWLGK